MDTITYLYIKRHSKTGLKYFGKTVQNPFKYYGSGTWWTRHIKVHGKEHVETLEVYGFDDLELCTNFAIIFSLENDIVNSKEWANLRIEDGLEGGDVSHTEAFKRSIKTQKRVAWNKGVSTPRTKEAIDKQRSTMIGMSWWNDGKTETKTKECPGDDFVKGRLWKPSQETKTKMSKASIGNTHARGTIQTTEANLKRSNALKGRKRSPESIKKMSETLKRRPVTWGDKISEGLIRTGCRKGEKNSMFGKTGELSPLKKHRWWNNGQTEVFAPVCPDGYSAGRIKKPKPSLEQVPSPDSLEHYHDHTKH